ncbi:GNAT family N-acetyltransferase [Embleya sp. NPDC005971]|uniref:GNAT family N-acetyltransferase n=1 Tax=Embleya sp. NPDC005971 TaxID=3156724 RepID=UPI0033DB89C8
MSRSRTFVVRGARAGDLDACAALLALHEGAPADAEADLRARVRTWFDRPDGCFLVATEPSTGADPVVGYARAVHLDPSPTAPVGYYLAGIVVAPTARRNGLGLRLTRARLAWIAERAESAWYFTNARNTASLHLHEALGFHEETREFTIPGVDFTGGEGVLAHLPLTGRPCPAAPGGRGPAEGG